MVDQIPAPAPANPAGSLSAHVPSAADAQASLQIAKNAGGSAFFAEATRLSAAGAVLSTADRQLFETLGRHRAEIDPAALAPASAARTPAQQHFDEAHGLAPDVNPADYHISIPAPVLAGLSGADHVTLQTDARALGAALNMDATTGSRFINEVLSTTTRLVQMTPEAREAQIEKWRGQTLSVYGERARDVAAQVDAWIASIGPNELVREFVNLGGVLDPAVISMIYGRAMARRARPA
jgi:hypothetical protein